MGHKRGKGWRPCKATHAFPNDDQQCTNKEYGELDHDSLLGSYVFALSLFPFSGCPSLVNDGEREGLCCSAAAGPEAEITGEVCLVIGSQYSVARS